MHRFSPASTLRRVAFLLVFGVVACSDEPPVGPGDDDEDPLPADVRSAVVIDTAGSVFRSIEIELDSAAQLEVFYQPVGGGRVFRIASEGAAAFHELPLPRLRQATDYAYAVRTRNDDAVSDSIYRGTFSTDSLPAELLGFEYAVTGASTFGMLMVPIRDPSGWAGQIAIESDGAIVWFMESVGGTLVAAPVPGTHDMIFIENGFPNDG
ncbi:MAG TPA: hypothetical protein VEA38_12585, partial [Terriglobales bacterium]|nr:hypothetical protein [Terriglobales bacterium]